MIREAILAATMNLVPAAPVDVLRFLRVPAIVWVLRRNHARLCGDRCSQRSRAAKRRLAGSAGWCR